MKDVVHVIISSHNRKAREAVGEIIREMFVVHGFEVMKDTAPVDRRYNPFAVIRTLPETEIRVEVRP